MDMQMPIMNGISATKLIRDIPYCKKVPIIALTANSNDSEKEECLQAGMNDLIAKPYTQLQLSAVIKQYACIFKQD
jgi:CheY-like chemotaxis protein